MAARISLHNIAEMRQFVNISKIYISKKELKKNVDTPMSITKAYAKKARFMLVSISYV